MGASVWISLRAPDRWVSIVTDRFMALIFGCDCVVEAGGCRGNRRFAYDKLVGITKFTGKIGAFTFMTARSV